jgi:hypothetical protein
MTNDYRALKEDMDRAAAVIFLSETQVQAGFALDAYEMAGRALEALNTIGAGTVAAWPHRDSLFRNLHSFLTHASNVSRLLWPGRPRQRKAESSIEYRQRLSTHPRVARGRFLRETLGVMEDHPLRSRALRDHLEHFDERLDQWQERAESRHYLQNYVGNAADRTSIRSEDQMRSYDPGRAVFGFRGQEYPLEPMRAAILELKHMAAGIAFEFSTGLAHVRGSSRPA